jgi:hypothetical protein
MVTVARGCDGDREVTRDRNGDRDRNRDDDGRWLR